MADCIVEIDLRTPDDQPATGYLEWVPTRRRDIVEGDDEWIELPSKFNIRLGTAYDDGTVTHDATPGMAWVSVAATDGSWCWRVTERIRGGTRRYVAVPDTPTADYQALVDVDPASMDPTVEPVAAWDAALANEITARGTADTALAADIADEIAARIAADDDLDTRLDAVEALDLTQATPVSPDGSYSLPLPTDTGFEFVIDADGLQDIKMNGVSL